MDRGMQKALEKLQSVRAGRPRRGAEDRGDGADLQRRRRRRSAVRDAVPADGHGAGRSGRGRPARLTPRRGARAWRASSLVARHSPATRRWWTRSLPAVEALEQATDLDSGLRAAVAGRRAGHAGDDAARRAQGTGQLPGRAQQRITRTPARPPPTTSSRAPPKRWRAERKTQMAKYAAALDQGTTQLAGDDLRPLGPGRVGVAEGARADLPQAGLGRARCQGDLGTLPGGARRGAGGGRRQRR